MISQTITDFVAWIKRAVTKPRDELDRWQRTARFTYDLARYGGRQLNRDRAPQMAAALAFRTLFALAPVLIVSMIVVKSISGTEGFVTLMRDIFQAVGLDQLRVTPPEGAAAAAESLPLSEWLLALIEQAADVNVTAIGWLGFGMIAYAAIGLLVTIESSFNTVLHSPHGRAWSRRVPAYWFVLTISPVVIGAAWYLDQQADAWMDSVVGWAPLFAVVRTLGRFAVAWLVLLAVYALLPNAHVRLSMAAIGAAVSALLLEGGSRIVGASLENMFALSQLYGSLGTVPLFMFGVYLMWLAVLFGLEVAATLQTLHGRKLDDIDAQASLPGMIDPASILPLMEIVAGQFASGRPTTAQFAAERCGMTEETAATFYEELVQAEVLHWVDMDAKSVTLARPAEKITGDELMDAAYRLVDSHRDQHSELVHKLRAAQRELASKATLAGMSAN